MIIGKSLSNINPVIFPTKIDRRINRVLTAANDLRDGASGEVGFIHATLCQTFFPCGKPQIGLRKWESINGHSAMRIEAGTAFDSNSGKWIDLPLPSGIKARLALIYLSTLAVKNKLPIVPLDRSMTAFLKNITGRQVNSRDIYIFKQQMAALGVATVRLASKYKQSNSHFVSVFDLIWMQQGTKRSLWPSELELSSGYWQGLKLKAVPIDMKALKAISHSALAIDIYLWLTHRLWRIDQPYTIYWKVLWQQFGQGYSRIRDFRVKFVKVLFQVNAVYPQANIEEYINQDGVSVGLKLFNSPPPIAPLAG